MSKTLAIMFQEINNTLRRKSFIVFAFLLPLALGLVALIFIWLNRDKNPEVALTPPAAVTTEMSSAGFVDPGGVLRQMPSALPPDFPTRFASTDAAQQALAASEIIGYYVISPGYIADGGITYVTNEYNPLSDRVGSAALEWALLVNVLGGDEIKAAALRQPLEVRVIALTNQQAQAGEESMLVELFPTLLVLVLYMVILLPAGALINAVTDEKKNRVMEVLLASVSPRQFITGKILALGILGLMQTAMWLGVMWLTYRYGGRSLQVPAEFSLSTSLLVWSVVYFIFGYAMYGAMLAGLGALVPDVKDARSVSVVLMSPLIVTYVLNIAIVERPHSMLALVLSLFPLTSPVAMIGRLSVTEVPVWQPAVAALLQFAAAIVILLVVARLFRAKYLLSGQPMNFQRYYRALMDR